jgi:hypothetical protein
MESIKKWTGEEGNHAPTRSAIGFGRQCQTNWNHNNVLIPCVDCL